MLQAAQEEIVGGRIACLAPGKRGFQTWRKSQGEGIGDATSHPVLKGEHGREGTVEAICPDMTIVGGINQLSIDPKLILRTLYASFEDLAHPTFLCRLARIGRLVLVGESRIARDHE